MTVGAVFAWNNNNDCYEYCSPIPSPSPSPIVKPCGDQEGEFDWNSQIICPTPTPQATPEAQPQVSGHIDGGTYSPPVCNGVNADKPVISSFTRLNPTTVQINFVSNNVDKFDIVYGYSQDKLVYGAVDISGSARQFNIGQLKEGSPIWVQVIAWRANCSIASDKIDP